MSEPLPEEFAAALAATAERRGSLGQPSFFLSSASSTNDIAMALAERGAPEGAVAIALTQTAGRGRQGREWFSPAGAGLYVSVLIRDAAIAPMLTLAGGVAVAQGIREATGLSVAIKWPNDIVVRDEMAPGKRRKIAGILAEAASAGGRVQHVVVGFGVNVRPAAYPAGLEKRVTSLERELGRPVDAGLVLSEILVALNQQVAALKAGEQAGVLERWKALAPSATGAAVEWNTSGNSLRGTTHGVDQDGALLIRVAGRLERVISGEVQWL